MSLRALVVGFLVLIGAVSRAADAAVVKSIAWGGGRTAAVVAPDEPGVYPVVARFAATRAEPGVATAYAARGYVHVDFSPIDPDAFGQAADRLFEAAYGLGGDERAVHAVVEDGLGPSAIAWMQRTAARRAGRFRALALVHPRRDESVETLRYGSFVPPPMLVVFDRATHDGAADAERYAERAREAGGAVHVEGASIEASQPLVLAFLASLEVARVARFESLRFDVVDEGPARIGTRDAGAAISGVAAAGSSSGARTRDAGDANPGWRAETLTAHDGALYAITLDRRSVLVRATADSPWVPHRRALANERYLALASVAFDADGEGRPFERTRRRLALVGTREGRLLVALDDGSPTTRDATLAGKIASATALTTVSIVAPTTAGGGASAMRIAVGDGLARLSIDRDGAPRIASEKLGAAQAGLRLAGDARSLYAWIPGIGLQRRLESEDARWTRVIDDRGAAPRAMALVPDPDGGGHDVLLVAHADGRVARIDPVTGRAEVELDLRRVLGGDAAIRYGDALAPLVHPVTNDLVHALPYTRDGEADAGFLVRQLDGRYRVSRARDFDEPRGSLARVDAIVASPYADERATRWYFAGVRGGDRCEAGACVADRCVSEPCAARMLAGSLATPPLREGYWYDRAQPGPGLALHPIGEQWMAIWLDYDAAGEPTWAVAVGELADGRFGTDSNGLAHYRRARGQARPVRVEGRSGALSIYVDDAPEHAECRDSRRRLDAAALATVVVERADGARTFCVEPIGHGATGRPAIDATGYWTLGGDASGVTASIATQGYGASARAAAVVLYHDAAGEPRWLLGTGLAHAGNTELELKRFRRGTGGIESTVAGTYAHALRGECGALSGTASILAPGMPGTHGVVLRQADLARVSDGLCY